MLAVNLIPVSSLLQDIYLSFPRNQHLLFATIGTTLRSGKGTEIKETCFSLSREK